MYHLLLYTPGVRLSWMLGQGPPWVGRQKTATTCLQRYSYLFFAGFTKRLLWLLRTRYESGVEGATPDPDYDGILRTLQACSSQTSQFRWDDLVALVEGKFPTSKHWFRLNQNLLRSLSPNLLLGAMDYFYLVQSLPEDRLVMVESQTGLVPIIVWAHSSWAWRSS